MSAPSSVPGKCSLQKAESEAPSPKRTTTSSEATSEMDASVDGDMENEEKIAKIAGAMRTILEVLLDIASVLFVFSNSACFVLVPG